MYNIHTVKANVFEIIYNNIIIIRARPDPWNLFLNGSFETDAKFPFSLS